MNTKRICTILLGLLALLTLTPLHAQQTAPAEEGGTRYFVLKPQGNYFLPKSADTRDVFGDVWETSGLIVELAQKRLCPQHEIALRIDPLIREVGDDHAYLVPLGVQYTGYFAPRRNVEPYWLVSADAVYIDLEVAERGINDSQLAFGMTAGLGAKVFERGFVQLTYQTTTHVQEFDLCGTKLAAGISF